MNLDMEGKVVFVSGSSRGIGLGIAKTLLEEGVLLLKEPEAYCKPNSHDEQFNKYLSPTLI